MVIINLNKEGEEPYIRLPAPHSHIIVTPPRSLAPSQQQQQDQRNPDTETENVITPPKPDIDATLFALNDERVHPFLESPPYPYKREHALSFHRMMYEECQNILHHPSPSEQGLLYNGCPFRDIRDTSLTSPTPGTDPGGDEGRGTVASAPKVGDILISRYPFYELPPDSEQRAKAQAYNKSLVVGHEDLIWGIGFWLLPSHHGQGIMSAVLNALIAEWLIPKMNVNILKSSALVGNEGSVRVHQKCGFVLEQTIEKGTKDMASYKFGGGGKRDIYVFKWVRSDRR